MPLSEYPRIPRMIQGHSQAIGLAAPLSEYVDVRRSCLDSSDNSSLSS